jgi:hypothetical protein
MDMSDTINDISDQDERMQHHGTRVEKDKSAARRGVVMQTLLDEKIANNGLYTNLFLHLVIIIFTVCYISCGMVFLEVKNNDEKDYLHGSLISFTVNYHEQKNTYRYECLKVDFTENNSLRDFSVEELFKINQDGYSFAEDKCISAAFGNCQELDIRKLFNGVIGVSCSNMLTMKLMSIIVSTFRIINK